MKLSINFEKSQKIQRPYYSRKRDKQKQVTTSLFVGRQNGKINRQRSFYGF